MRAANLHLHPGPPRNLLVNRGGGGVETSTPASRYLSRGPVDVSTVTLYRPSSSLVILSPLRAAQKDTEPQGEGWRPPPLHPLPTDPDHEPRNTVRRAP